MRAVYLPFLGGWLGLGLVTGSATEEHLLTVYQSLAVQATEATVGQVSYATWYGAEEETTLAAMAWTMILSSPHEEPSTSDRNWASVLGIEFNLERREQGWRLTMDLSKMKPIPERLLSEVEDGPLDRESIVESLLVAADKNLLAVGVFDCDLSVLGEKSHADLAKLTFPPKLNSAEALWGSWSHPDLRRQYPEGDLHQLAARSLVQPESLLTIFLIVSSETQPPEAMGAFLQQLLARVGDDAFARILKDSETLVQERILSALDTASTGKRLFPKTYALAKSPTPPSKDAPTSR